MEPWGTTEGFHTTTSDLEQRDPLGWQSLCHVGYEPGTKGRTSWLIPPMLLPTQRAAEPSAVGLGHLSWVFLQAM